MGCDIHAVIERRTTYGNRYEWLNSGDPDIGRNYEMFAVLAGVRNHHDVEPIAEPRGLPACEGWGEPYSDGSRWLRFTDWEERPCSYIVEKAESYGLDMHSASWLTLAEIKAFDTEQEVDDQALIVARRDDGGVAMTARATTGSHEGKVGRRKILRWPGEDEPTCWLRLIRYMEQAKWDGQSDEEVRLVFFFDN